MELISGPHWNTVGVPGSLRSEWQPLYECEAERAEKTATYFAITDENK